MTRLVKTRYSAFYSAFMSQNLWKIAHFDCFTPSACAAQYIESLTERRPKEAGFAAGRLACRAAFLSRKSFDPRFLFRVDFELLVQPCQLQQLGYAR